MSYRPEYKPLVGNDSWATARAAAVADKEKEDRRTCPALRF